MKQTQQLLLSISIGILFILSYTPQATAFGENATINATVKLNVCGDNIVEGPEDCEGMNLNGKTCTNSGYTSGTLTCDIACSFDTTSCIYIPPTATPQSSTSKQPTLTPTFLQSNPLQTTTLTPPTTQSFPISRSQTKLPPSLQKFDFNHIGILSMQDLPNIIQFWVNNWKLSLQGKSPTNTNCDANNDNHCDLKDFSLVLYYIER